MLHLLLELFHLPILMHNSLFINKCMLHYYPRHVLSINMPIFRRTNCIHTASGIVALCKRLHSTPVESRLQSRIKNCALKLVNEIILYYDAQSKKHQIFLLIIWECVKPSISVESSAFGQVRNLIRSKAVMQRWYTVWLRENTLKRGCEWAAVRA